MPSVSLLTTAEVAELFRVHEATVAKWARDGVLAFVKSPGGKDYRFRSDDVERLLESAREASA